MASGWKKLLPRRRFWFVVGSIVIVAIAVRVALPPFLKDYVNEKLDSIPDYDGHVGDIDVQLIRGAYVIKDVELVKTTGKVPVPFVAADHVDLSVQWGALMEGAFVGEMEFDKARLNFVSGPSKAQSQKSIDKSWLPTVDDLFPLRINKFVITDGEIHYLDENHDPRIDIFVDSLFVVAKNLTNSKDISDTLYAAVEAKGVAMKQAPVTLHIETDPNADHKTFDLNGSLRHLKLVQLNSLAKSYGNFDFEKGSVDMDAELAAANGRIHGYVKPIFHDVKIVDLKEDAKNPVKLVWESIVSVVAQLMTNHSEDDMATRIPIKGSTDDPNTDILSVVGGLLSNAFVEALKPGVEGTVDLEKTDSKEKEKTKKEAREEVNEKKEGGGR